MAIPEPSSWREALERAERMTVSNLVTLETIEVMFNPTEWSVAFDVNWQRFTVPGLSHQPKHYVNTNNAVIPLDLYYRAHTSAQLDEMRDKMQFFESLGYPVASDQVVSGGPPRILFRWPKVATMICTLNSYAQNFVQFVRLGRVRIARTRVEIEEIRDRRLLSDEVRRFGLVRAGSQSAPERFFAGDL